MSPVPDPDLVARFGADASPPPGAVGIAVSGGPDSLALLLLAAAAWPERVIAATVDHGLRPEAAAEAAYVGAICARRGIAHETLVPATPITGSLQAAARTARYGLLENWRARHGAGCVMTAHHADDQAETLLMRLNRSAGLGGLAGIRRANGFVLRPLLGWRHSELVAIVEAAGIEPVSDPSNHDDRFDRVRMRAALAGSDWIDVRAVAASASHLADAEAAMAWMVARLSEERVVVEDEAFLLDPAGLPDELVRRLVLDMIARVDPVAAPGGPPLDRLLATLRAGGQASIGAALCRGGPRWRVAPAPARRGGK
ncbi:tRNA lysidine(34) synthetase TilS [Sphingomonas colocasiae]|uniref:tRNA(Ile)-lysidine synthase n=1 Tax=Sphingomonas colocasiae TaxID=1848973 RepID=A0ABS7PTB8_9SPHN|nr:tRNA lysidine(34) synthetase TilS [Sphingomonas colocasiae]MBY8824589.1 tRNA lysidine(34) synthetase TilS [Sphingomonas colocasiae]